MAIRTAGYDLLQREEEKKIMIILSDGRPYDVLGVFAGEEKDLATEKKIFGKDFAYIRDIANFSKIVGRYLTKQLEIDG